SQNSGSISLNEKTYIKNALVNGTTLRFVLTPTDPATAATFTGATNNNRLTRPQLSLDIASAPTGQKTLTFKPQPSGITAWDSTSTNMIDPNYGPTHFTDGDTVIFANQTLNGTAGFTQ